MKLRILMKAVITRNCIDETFTTHKNNLEFSYIYRENSKVNG